MSPDRFTFAPRPRWETELAFAEQAGEARDDDAAEADTVALTEPSLGRLAGAQVASCPVPQAPSWGVVAGQVWVTFGGLDGPHELALDDLHADVLLGKLARALGLFPPPGAVPPVLAVTAEVAAPDGEELFPEAGTPAPWPATTSGAVPMKVGGVLWPPGPLGLSAERVAYLIRSAQTDPEFMSSTDPGLSRSRLQKLLAGVPQNRQIAGALMVWCDAAGVLAPPTTPKPFRTSRPLRADLDLSAIAGRLAATPHPNAAQVADAFLGES